MLTPLARSLCGNARGWVSSTIKVHPRLQLVRPVTHDRSMAQRFAPSCGGICFARRKAVAHL